MVPTFLGSTILVFTILQMAPGGPIEQIMLELQMGGAIVGEGGGGASSGITGGVSLPPKALKELERLTGSNIYFRGNSITIKGNKNANEKVKIAIEYFINRIRSDKKIDKNDIIASLNKDMTQDIKNQSTVQSLEEAIKTP